MSEVTRYTCWCQEVQPHPTGLHDTRAVVKGCNHMSRADSTGPPARQHRPARRRNLLPRLHLRRCPTPTRPHPAGPPKWRPRFIIIATPLALFANPSPPAFWPIPGSVLPQRPSQPRQVPSGAGPRLGRKNTPPGVESPYGAPVASEGPLPGALGWVAEGWAVF